MSGLFVLGAERAGARVFAHALAFEETAPLCEDLAQGARRIGAGQRVVALATGLDALARAAEPMAASPAARAVVVWRRAVDFVASRRRARPDESFFDACLTWRRTKEAAQKLAAQFPGRVILLGLHDLLDPAAGPFVAGFRLDGAGFAAFLEASAQGRTALDPRRPVADPARMAWTMGEIEMFARVCGEAVDLEAAARRRPLDLALWAYERGFCLGGAAVAPAGRAWRLDLPGAAGAAQVRLAAVPARGRRRLRAQGAPGFRLEIVEALTRRPLFAGAGPKIDAELPAHDGCVEVAFVGLGQGGADLLGAGLSHA